MISWFPESILWGSVAIFFLRVTDVSLSVLRTILTVRGRNISAGLIAFVEVSIFVVAISQVLRNIQHPAQIFAYSGGFACGTILGGYIEKWIGLGYVMVSVHCKDEWRLVAGELRAEGFGATEYVATGKDGPVHVVDTLVKRKDFPYVLEVIHAVAPDAFVHATDQAFIRRGFVPRRKYK